LSAVEVNLNNLDMDALTTTGNAYGSPSASGSAFVGAKGTEIIMKKVLFSLSLFIIFIVFITSCAGVHHEEMYHNDKIDKQILDSVKVIDDEVLDDIKNDNQNRLNKLGSEAFKNEPLSSNELLDTMSKQVKDKSFDYQDRYYFVSKKIGNSKFTMNISKDQYITLEATNSDIFVSLRKSNSNKHDYLLATVYVKEQGEWKLDRFALKDYSYDGMNAIDLYEKAKSLNAQGYKIPALTYGVLSAVTLHPASFLHYQKENEITDFYKKLADDVKNAHLFPQKLKNSNNLEIYSVTVRNDVEGVIPVIRYVTGIELSNKEAIEKEANDINDEVNSLYPGMKESFKQLIYEAYSEEPVDSKKTYNYYRTTVEQK
jgi:preprotein translocase subunit SecG